eukprot:c5497_g1_i1.p1 GENE.c5497_g1_i1~~c5497_g1_i1.p1  ORF type:complete len:448 (-),score=111.38 c5497_g1_i1:74-1417(-)
MENSLPSAPLHFLTAWGRALLQNSEFAEYVKELEAAEAARELASNQARQLTGLLHAATAVQEAGDEQAFEKVCEQINTVVVQVTKSSILTRIEGQAEEDQVNRWGRLSDCMSNVVRLRGFSVFLQTGKLIRQGDCTEFTDEEFMGGVISLIHDLARYSVGRAIKHDTVSVTLAREVTDQVMNEFLKFDFRNGPLRRKYDGIKYGLRKIENILYELSVTGHAENLPEKSVSPVTRVYAEDFDAIRKRMELFDEQREKVIKRCRDVQKAAKQAIFALHRNDTNRATRLLESACQATNELLPTVTETPALRSGSFSNAMEEYAEACLLKEWLENKRLASRKDLGFVNSEEYVGALCDLTGEIGRYAVTRATHRDVSAVEQCLETDLAIMTTIIQLPIPSKLFKKLEPLRMAISKLEMILYELSLRSTRGVGGGLADDEGAGAGAGAAGDD